MADIKKYLIKYKTDIIALFALTAFFLFFAAISIKKPGSIIYDTGREVLIPELILKGKLLYKEIFAMYNPLSYQLNALLYYLFGVSFDTLCTACAINAYLILIGCYFIGRQIMSAFSSTAACIIISGFCIFSVKQTTCDYLFPYSYAMIYALCAFIYFSLFSVLYIKSKETQNKVNHNLTYIASVCMGLSVAFRFEYILAYIPFIVLLIKNKVPVKHLFGNFVIFLTPSIISWGFLFLQGFNFQDLANYIEFGKNLFATTEQKTYQKHGASPLALFEHFKFLVVSSLMFFIFVFFNIKFMRYIRNTERYKKIFVSAIYTIFFFTINLWIINLLQYGMFSFLCLLCLYIAAVSYKKSETVKDKIMFILSLYSILSCVRIGFVFCFGYAVFYMLVPIIVNYAYFIEISETNNSDFKIEYKKEAAEFLILISLLSLFYKSYKNIFWVKKIETVRGTLYQLEIKAQVYNRAVEWIKNNTNPSDSILVLPEGPMLNFMTNRPTNSQYYQLLPNHIAAIGEKKILENLKRNPPNYIFIQDVDCSLYGKETFGKDFGLEIVSFIKENYKFETQFVSQNKDKTEEIFFINILKHK